MYGSGSVKVEFRCINDFRIASTLDIGSSTLIIQEKNVELEMD